MDSGEKTQSPNSPKATSIGDAMNTVENDEPNSSKAMSTGDAANTVETDDTNVKSDQPVSGEKKSKGPSMDPANLHYEGELCIYTDPDTKYQYHWEAATQQWVAHNQQPADLGNDSKPPGGNLTETFL